MKKCTHLTAVSRDRARLAWGQRTHHLAGRQAMPATLALTPLVALIALVALGAVASMLLPAPSWAAGGAPSATEAEDPDFQAGVAAIKRQDWPAAISRLSAVVQRQDGKADAWNWLGYAYRQTDQMERSFAAYERALKIEPGHRGALEYLGEAYLKVGRLPEAEAQLRLLDKACWLPCEEFRDLQAKILAYKKKSAS
ncbi:MAG: hypothetical protein RL722_2035 [Pseudomonadota bacterium]